MSRDIIGREVQVIHFSDRPRIDISENEEVDKMIYCEDFHGEYALQWIRCYKDGRLTEQHNVQFLESIIFVRASKPPCPIKKDHFLGTPPEDYVDCPEYCSDCKYEPVGAK